jgi:hypothetical protein
MAGIIDPKSLNWISKNTVLISTGDSVDRGNDTIAVYALWRKLALQAPTHQSEVVNLLGNHEVLNLVDDPTYVRQHKEKYLSDTELKSFSKNAHTKKSESLSYMTWRRREFSEIGTIGKQIRSFNLVHEVDGNIFLHGGISKKFALKAAKYNDQIKFLNNDAQIEIKNKKYFAPILYDEDSPLWFVQAVLYFLYTSSIEKLF